MTDEAQTLEPPPVAARGGDAGAGTPARSRRSPPSRSLNRARRRRPTTRGEAAIGHAAPQAAQPGAQSENADLLRRLADLKRVRDGDAAPRAADFNGDTVAFERARQSYDTRQAVREGAPPARGERTRRPRSRGPARSGNRLP